MLIVHHLDTSQSERIVWLAEEMGLDYELRTHARLPDTRLSPPSLQAVHPLGSAPVIEDNGHVLAESGAIMDYLMARYGDHGLRPAPDHPDYVHYIYWFHYANGGMMLQTSINFVAAMATGGDSAHPVMAAMQGRMARHLAWVDDYLAKNPYFGGSQFSAADIMMHFAFTTMRSFHVVPTEDRPHILAWLRRISERPAYQRAMRKAGHTSDPAAFAQA